MLKKNLATATLMTIVTTVLLGVVYPLVITAVARAAFRGQANGQLIERNGQKVGSRIIGQPFSGPGYFHSRPSAAGNGYDAANSGGSNLGPTNQTLIARIHDDAARVQGENPSVMVPIDAVTMSASGLDPHISVAYADFQVPRVARERNVPEQTIRELVRSHTEGRQFGVLGEPRVNVLELNFALGK